MRGIGETSGSLFSYVDLKARIPARHPLRKVRQVVNDALANLDSEFEALYTDFVRPSIAAERLIRASLLQIHFSVRSERQLMEQMQYNLLFRWFVGLGIDNQVWVPTVFMKNRGQLLTTEMSRRSCRTSFSVDGMLVKAWASMKSFQPKPDVAPPDDEGPDDPPAPDTTAADQPEQTRTETRPTDQYRNAEVDFRGENVRTPPMSRQPIRTPGSTRSRLAPGRRCASSAML